MTKQKLSAAALEFFREQGRRGGKLSAPARMKKLTAEQRSEIAKKASVVGVRVRKAKARARAKKAKA